MPRRQYNPGGSKKYVTSRVGEYQLAYRQVTLFLCPIPKCEMCVATSELAEHTQYHIERGHVKPYADIRKS